MKTKNNVQKTILRWAAVVISFVLISFTVSAQDFWKKLLTNSSFNEIALAMVETSEKTESPVSSDTDYSLFYYLEEENELSLDVETWMTDESNFETISLYLLEEVDNDLLLEDWMFNEKLFQTLEGGEQPLELEAWMTSDKVWKI